MGGTQYRVGAVAYRAHGQGPSEARADSRACLLRDVDSEGKVLTGRLSVRVRVRRVRVPGRVAGWQGGTKSLTDYASGV